MSAQGKSRSVPLEWTDEMVGALWRYQAEENIDDYFTNLFGDRILEATARYVPADAVVCDYGCGPGFLLERLLQHHRAFGFDFTRANIEKARLRVAGNPNLAGLFTFEAGDLPAGAADVTYVVETVEHLLPHHVDGFFEKVRHVLKPDGLVIVSTPNDENLAAATVYCPCCNKTFHRWQHVRSFNAATLSSFMERGGFRRVAAFSTDFSAAGAWSRLKVRLRPSFGRWNPHLVYIGRVR